MQFNRWRDLSLHTASVAEGENNINPRMTSNSVRHHIWGQRFPLNVCNQTRGYVETVCHEPTSPVMNCFLHLNLCMEVGLWHSFPHLPWKNVLCLPEGGGACWSRSTESVAERPFKGAKAGPPQLEPLTSLLERETSDSTEQQQGKARFLHSLEKKQWGTYRRHQILSNVINAWFSLKPDSICTFSISQKIPEQTLISHFSTELQMSGRLKSPMTTQQLFTLHWSGSLHPSYFSLTSTGI